MSREWAKKYIEHMIAGDFESSIPLRNYYLPKTVFKYRKLGDQTIESLKNNELFLAKIGSLNDPFECSLQFDNDANLRLYFSSDEFQEKIREKFGMVLTAHEHDSIIRSKKPWIAYSQLCKSKGIILNMSAEQQIDVVQQRWAKILNDIKNDIRVSCFTERNDSLLMWSHYADEHKGICIEYDFANTHIGMFLSPISYSNDIYKIKTIDDLNPLQQIGASLTKSKEWEYEMEWRYTPIKPANSNLPEKVKIPNPIAVYLGTRFDKNEPKLQRELLSVLADKNVRVYSMTSHPTEYKLVKVSFARHLLSNLHT